MLNDESCTHDQARAPERLQGKAFWLMGRAARTAQLLTQERLFDVGLRRGFYGVLATLDEFGPAAQADMGRRLGIDRSDMVAILNDLEQEKFVTRKPDPDDRRRNRVIITAAGHRALEKFDQAIGEAENELLRDFSKTERQQLIKLLSRLG